MCDLQHIFLFPLKLVFSIMNYFPQKSKSFFTWKECHFLKTHPFFCEFCRNLQILFPSSAPVGRNLGVFYNNFTNFRSLFVKPLHFLPTFFHPAGR